MLNDEKFTRVLTDVENGIYLENFTISHTDVGDPGNWLITKRRLHGGLSDGVDEITVSNSELSFKVLPTRGMNLYKGSYHGIPIGWNSPVKAPVNPAFVNLMDMGGLGFLKGFNEWVCHCGLASHGGPGPDTITDDQGNVVSSTDLTLHGRIANIPAKYVEVQIIPGTPAELVIIGVTEEASFCGAQYRMTTRISTKVGSSLVTIRDEVLNYGALPAELELLYHSNFGMPWAEGGAKLFAPIKTLCPRNSHAASDIAIWDTYQQPVAGFPEQCYYADMYGNPEGETLCVLQNAAGDKAAALRWNVRQLPYFCQWKHPNDDREAYVTGLEPCTSFPNHKSFERANGRVLTLEPGATYTTQVSYQFADQPADVQKLKAEVAELQKCGPATINPAQLPQWTPDA